MRYITGLYLSSVCNKTALLYHENNKFDVAKKKTFNQTAFGRAVDSVVSNSRLQTTGICTDVEVDRHE